jgi:hypothetical protein
VKLYVSYRRPITANGRIIGYIVTLSDGGTFYVQRKRVSRGACVNYGINARYMFA